MNANDVVSLNMRKRREELELTQEEAAASLREKGWRISTDSYRLAEASFRTARKRKFDADELLAICFAFDMTMGALFRPPDGWVTIFDGHAGLSDSYMEVVFSG